MTACSAAPSPAFHAPATAGEPALPARGRRGPAAGPARTGAGKIAWRAAGRPEEPPATPS
ncbi:hypothetical protein [Nonomuraea wenchangensis]|uniref:hypothetical protein n=1 Tax=Nonomuraea wenchangensis TaxID=568860 RepID=UPI001160D615|nr:hypothetical protein [Nonomuraea wenchangensis]